MPRFPIETRPDGALLEMLIMRNGPRQYIVHFAVDGRVLVMLTYHRLVDRITIRCKPWREVAAGDAFALGLLQAHASLVARYLRNQTAERRAAAAAMQPAPPSDRGID